MWQLATKIDKEQNIYQFYFYSEIFESCNTIFVFMSISQGLMILANICSDIGVKDHNGFCFKIILFFVFLLLRFLSQQISIAYANRFIYEIDIKKDIKNQ